MIQIETCDFKNTPQVNIRAKIKMNTCGWWKINNVTNESAFKIQLFINSNLHLLIVNINYNELNKKDPINS